MNRSLDGYVPRARHDDLLTEGLGDETLVYDMRTHKAHCLNRTAALVWSRCDGKLTVSEMRVALEHELQAPISSDVIWLAIEQLGKAKLLSDRLPNSVPQAAMTRRAVIKKIGLGAAIAVPLVTSILAPTAEASVTCRVNGTMCVNNSDCCSNHCTCISGGSPPCTGAGGTCQP